MDEATREAIYEAAQRSLPDPRAMRDQVQQLERDVAFSLAHKDEWRLLYPDCLVAVHDGRLVAAEPDEQRLLEALARVGIAPEDTYFDFVPGEKSILML